MLSLGAIWFGVSGCYVLVMHAKKLQDSGALTLFWKVNVLPWAVVGLVLDAAFNLFFGSLMFLERPRELLFTARIQRHMTSDGLRLRLARWWKKQLNAIEPDHIK